MDASGSPRVDVVDRLYAFFFNIEKTDFPPRSKQKKKVLKYTKLPEFDLETNGSWPLHRYSLQPRLRRIVSLEEPRTNTSRSLKILDTAITPQAIPPNTNKRKIVTITEDTNDLHPKFSKSKLCNKSTITSNRSTETNLKKETPQKSSYRVATSAKYINETRPGNKINKVNDKKEVVTKSGFRSRLSKVNSEGAEKIPRSPIEKAAAGKPKSTSMRRNNLSTATESDQELSIIRTKLHGNTNSKTSKKQTEKQQKHSPPASLKKTKGSTLLLEMQSKNKPVSVIHVPLDEQIHNPHGTPCNTEKKEEAKSVLAFTKPTESEIIVHKDKNVGTDPLPTKIDQDTDMCGVEPEIVTKRIESTGTQADLIESTFDKLDIPNVSLRKDKSEHKESLSDLPISSLPNLEIPSLNITDNRNEKSFHDSHYCNSTSYIFSRATLTYRTQQKIDFHIVGSDNAYSNQSPSPLTYPMNVVSVYREEMSSKDISNDISLEESHENKSSKELKNCINEIKSLNCSYVPNTKKLMKPSDIISTVRVNNELFQSVVLCEQFQRELNFIDSFFESLQYLESCSLSEKCFKNAKINDIIDNPALFDSEFTTRKSEYDSFLSKLENGANSDDSETIASKNLFLLNVLIRDEQRRAKNLLSVLKRREDALKDFTKSHILYLENKKKQENTDISALKKKQRGALLKLQHECGEMQRMRKALLALSEKRKVALMKTKKDLELKLKNNVDVEQIILGKKKPKTNTVADRSSVPLKCFDLSSSGSEDSSSPRSTSDGVASGSEKGAGMEVSAPAGPLAPGLAEKSVQTGNCTLDSTLVSRATDTAAEHFVIVDGTYLNILFHNLTLPQMFSGRKQYEVNEEALRNLIDSTNTRRTENWNEVVEKLMEQVKNGDNEDDDEDKSSTPSTARSLVEEFEQYYRTLGEEDRSPEDVSDSNAPSQVYEASEVLAQTAPCDLDSCNSKRSAETAFEEIYEEGVIELSVEESKECELVAGDVKEAEANTSGPLPVPAGAADPSPPPAEPPASPSRLSSDATCTESSGSSEPPSKQVSSVSSVEPAHSEAEELRRQQLAIEREIKELEQQQCRLLVVREIPDKPPPPYTPPVEPRPPAPPRPFRPDEETNLRVRDYVTDPNVNVYDPTDAFDVLVHDFCQETLERHKLDQSDKPWDACNLLPPKPPVDTDSLVETATTGLAEILTTATSSVVSGVSSRRSDHIDGILFTEWRHAEPEWTALHSDDALVKNQLFETIFQRILTETVDEYKRTVLSPI